MKNNKLYFVFLFLSILFASCNGEEVIEKWPEIGNYYDSSKPIEFIKSIRLNRALELLQSHKYTITEVSELCGYSSISYFSTVFKKYFGKSPTEV